MPSKKKKDKRLLFIAVGLLVFLPGGHKLNNEHKIAQPTESKRSKSESNVVNTQTRTTSIDLPYTVPQMRPLEIYVKPVRPRHWYGKNERNQRLTQAITLIMSLRNHQHLQAEDDIRIFEVINRYASRQKHLHLVQVPQKVRGRISMGYSCVRDHYAIGSWENPVSLMSMDLYHEAMHEVQCDQIMKQLGITEHKNLDPETIHNISRCDIEAPAYAASIRIFLALIDRGLLDKEIPMSKMVGDPIQTVKESWESLLKGRQSFCRFIINSYGNYIKDLVSAH